MGIHNTLVDLNNHLFAQMERLSDEDMTPEELEKEIKRADAMKDIATQIINNASIVLKATELNMEYSKSEVAVPSMLIGHNDGKGVND